MSKSQSTTAEDGKKILTRHPAGKNGVNISRAKYDTLKQAILSHLQNVELTHTELFKLLNKTLKGRFDGSISWYGEVVKLDLEARGIVSRTSAKPATYRLTAKAKSK